MMMGLGSCTATTDVASGAVMMVCADPVIVPPITAQPVVVPSVPITPLPPVIDPVAAPSLIAGISTSTLLLIGAALLIMSHK
jgi:hypothetical protein